MLIKKNYLRHYREFFFTNVNSILFRLFTSKFSFLSNNLKGKKILDLGCGCTLNFSFFSYLKMKPFGVETSLQIIKNISKKIGKKYDLRVGTNDNIPFKSNFFDYIIAIHSFYYLAKDKKILDNIKEIKRVCKKDGYIIFTIPKLKLLHLKFKKIDKYHYRVVNDKYNLRKNEIFFLFKNKSDIKKMFSKFFSVCEIGESEYKIGPLSEYHYWIICKKNTGK